MSGRRAKQRRRMVKMAIAGDIPAQQWCASRMTVARLLRAARRAKGLSAPHNAQLGVQEGTGKRLPRRARRHG